MERTKRRELTIVWNTYMEYNILDAVMAMFSEKALREAEEAAAKIAMEKVA